MASTDIAEDAHLISTRVDASSLRQKAVSGLRDISQPLQGFYVYSWAIEVYAVICLTLFLPIALEQYARDAGRLASDHTLPCTDATAICEVALLGIWTNTASFSLYTYSASVALQAIAVIAISKAANDTSARWSLLCACTVLGGLSCILFLLLPSGSTAWPVVVLLTMCGNVAFGAGMVCLNAYLPALAREEHAVISADTEEAEEESAAIARLTSTISSRGTAAGYAAGITLLLMLLLPVTLLKGSLFSLRLSIAITGFWWLAFSVPALRCLLPPNSTSEPLLAFQRSLLEPWQELWLLIREYRRLPETFRYLAAWFIMSDAFATITSTAVLFAKTTLGMPASSLIWIGVLTPVFGILGALTWPWLQANILRTNNIATLRIIVALSVLIPIYGLLALTTPTELLLLSCYFGFLYGALQSYSRAVFVSLIPPPEAARFFALYSITDKSSSFIGPALVALIADRTGSVLASFVFLVVALVLPQPLLARVDVSKGAHVAAEYGSRSGN